MYLFSSFSYTLITSSYNKSTTYAYTHTEHFCRVLPPHTKLRKMYTVFKGKFGGKVYFLLSDYARKKNIQLSILNVSRNEQIQEEGKQKKNKTKKVSIVTSCRGLPTFRQEIFEEYVSI